MSDNVVRKALIKETSRNIDNIAQQLNDGAVADKELIVELINKMIDFVDKFVSKKQVQYDYSCCGPCEHSAVGADGPVCSKHAEFIREMCPADCDKIKEVRDAS